MKLQDIFAPPQPQVLRAPEIRYIPAPQPPPQPKAASQPKPPPPPPPKRSKERKCNPAEQFERTIQLHVIGYINRHVTDEPSPTNIMYINEGCRILAEELDRHILSYGYEHDGFRFGDHFCIMDTFHETMRQIADIRGTLPPWLVLHDDWFKREEEHKQQEEEFKRQQAERQEEKIQESVVEFREVLYADET
jgi:hypothetical protein